MNIPPTIAKKVTLEELALFLRKVSHNACSTSKAGEILELVKEDEAINGEYQDKKMSRAIESCMEYFISLQ